MFELPGPVVVGTDGSPAADRAIRWAADDASRLHRALHIVHVVESRIYDGPAYVVPGLRERLVDQGTEILRAARDLALEHHAALPVETRLVHDKTVCAGLRVHAADATELVVGHRGLGGFTGLLLGSVGLELVGHLRLPVVIVRGEEDAPADEIVAGVDLIDPPDPVLEYAFKAAAGRGARLRVVHAWRPSPLSFEAGIDIQEATTTFEDHLAAAISPWRERNPDVKVIEEVMRSHPADALVGASAHADLLVLGYRTHAGPHLGSVSHAAIHHAHCPVTVVRHRPPQEGGSSGT